MSCSSTPPGDLDRTIAGLLVRLRPQLKRMLARFRIPEIEGEDLLQEACLSLVRDWPRIENPEAWIMGTFYRQCCVYCRRKRRRQWLQYLDLQLLEAFAQVQRAPQERAELLWDLATSCAFLPRRLRLLLELRYGFGMSAEEIAVQLGYRPSSIRKLSARALAQARRAARR
jgi:RNA polymerase sigma factor (sigma-70 family)